MLVNRLREEPDIGPMGINKMQDPNGAKGRELVQNSSGGQTHDFRCCSLFKYVDVFTACCHLIMQVKVEHSTHRGLLTGLGEYKAFSGSSSLLEDTSSRLMLL